jgi:hypothetical protein
LSKEKHVEGNSNYITIETVAYSIHSHRQAAFRLTYEVTPRGDGARRWFLVAMEELEGPAPSLNPALGL